MDKNGREKEMLYNWGMKNSSDQYFQANDKEKDSYFTKRDGDIVPYIREYGFDTLPELISELDILWKTDEVFEQIKKVIGIAALKNKPSKMVPEDITAGNEKKKEKDKLPAFIYNF